MAVIVSSQILSVFIISLVVGMGGLGNDFTCDQTCFSQCPSYQFIAYEDSNCETGTKTVLWTFISAFSNDAVFAIKDDNGEFLDSLPPYIVGFVSGNDGIVQICPKRTIHGYTILWNIWSDGEIICQSSAVITVNQEYTTLFVTNSPSLTPSFDESTALSSMTIWTSPLPFDENTTQSIATTSQFSDSESPSSSSMISSTTLNPSNENDGGKTATAAEITTYTGIATLVIVLISVVVVIILICRRMKKSSQQQHSYSAGRQATANQFGNKSMVMLNQVLTSSPTMRSASSNSSDEPAPKDKAPDKATEANEDQCVSGSTDNGTTRRPEGQPSFQRNGLEDGEIEDPGREMLSMTDQTNDQNAIILMAATPR